MVEQRGNFSKAVLCTCELRVYFSKPVGMNIPVDPPRFSTPRFSENSTGLGEREYSY